MLQIIVWLGGDSHDSKQDKALRILASQPVMSVQVLSETVSIMRRKLGFDGVAIRSEVI